MKCTKMGCDGVMIPGQEVGSFLLMTCGKCGHSHRAHLEDLVSKKVKRARRKMEKELLNDPAALSPLEEEKKRLVNARMEIPNKKHTRCERDRKLVMKVKLGELSTLDQVISEGAWKENP